MTTETYEVEEIKGSDASTMAADSEAIELSERLGLAGQLSLANKETATRLPYRCITAEERAIFETIFPNKTKVEDYRDGIIPLRVLQLVAHCREIKMFDRGLVVWHPAKGVSDPVLVGLKTHRNAGWTFDVEETYLLARWGDSLLPLEDLKAKARKVLTDRWNSKLKQAVAQATIAMGSVEAKVDEMLNGGAAYGDPYFSSF